MNDLLFDVPTGALSELSVARARFAAAKDAYDKASECEDEFGEAIPKEVSREMHDARIGLTKAERREIDRRKQV